MIYFDRFGAQDTSPEVQAKMDALLRDKTPEEKLVMVMERMQFMRDLREATKHFRNHEVDESTDPSSD